MIDRLNLWGLVIAIYILCTSTRCFNATSFKFVEFPYKETKKNEIIFGEFEAACMQSNTCSAKKGLENIQCVRECISPPCYAAIYKSDELEEGEIDIRLTSFKGCFIQRSKNRTH